MIEPAASFRRGLAGRSGGRSAAQPAAVRPWQRAAPARWRAARPCQCLRRPMSATMGQLDSVAEESLKSSKCWCPSAKAKQLVDVADIARATSALQRRRWHAPPRLGVSRAS